MRKFLIFFLILVSAIGVAQNRYLVVFTDKIETGFNPEAYFDTAAIKSFELQGLPKYDWYDLPVNSDYIAEVIEFVDSTRFDLRWFNGLVVYGTPNQMTEVEQLYFVKNII